MNLPKGVYQHNSRAVRGYGNVRYESGDLDELIVKFTKGVYWLQEHRPYAADKPIKPYVPAPLDGSDPWDTIALPLIDKHNMQMNYATDAFTVWHMRASEDGDSRLYIFLIWKDLTLLSWTNLLAAKEAPVVSVD